MAEAQQERTHVRVAVGVSRCHLQLLTSTLASGLGLAAAVAWRCLSEGVACWLLSRHLMLVHRATAALQSYSLWNCVQWRGSEAPAQVQSVKPQLGISRRWARLGETCCSDALHGACCMPNSSPAMRAEGRPQGCRGVCRLVGSGCCAIGPTVPFYSCTQTLSEAMSM